MKIIILTGEYGSGKTEFALNLAVELSKDNKVAICDLDVINYYYRSRHAHKMLAEHDIWMEGSNLDNDDAQDLPAVSYGIKGVIQQKTRDVVIFDLAGSHNGTKLLASFQDVFVDNKPELWFVANIYRERTATPEGIEKVISEIEEQCKMKVTGLVNNSNLLNFTTTEDILAGQEVVKEVAKKNDLKIEYSFIDAKFKDKLTNLEGKTLTFDELIIRDKWL